MRLAFVFVEKLSQDRISFLQQIKTQTAFQNEQTLLHAFLRMEMHRDLILPLHEMADLNYLVSYSQKHPFSLFLNSLGNKHTNDRGSLRKMEKTQNTFLLWWILTHKTLFDRNSTAPKEKKKPNSKSKACNTKYNSTIYMLFSQG